MSTLLIALLAGCDADCEDPTRLNKTWAMWHDPLTATSASVDESYPTYEVFSNGWSKWKISWSQDGANVDVDITDAREAQGDMNEVAPDTQAFSGQLLADEDNCNALALELSGDYATSSGTVHAFTYTSTVMFYGDHLAGTYTYADTYDGGGMSEITGEFYGAAEEATDFDTGFVPYEPS